MARSVWRERWMHARASGFLRWILSWASACAALGAQPCVTVAAETARPAWKDVSLSLSEGTWMSLDVSPDGRTIAFSSDRDRDDNEIYLMRADGSNQRPITDDFRIDDHSPSWSPDMSIRPTPAGAPCSGSKPCWWAPR